MIQHLNPTPITPARTVVIGSGGFVGGAVLRRLAAAGAPAIGVSRAEVDLLAPDAADQLAALLRPGDAVVAAAAKAPCKNAEMLVENALIIRALVGALKRSSPAHVINISSDAVYADGPVPLTESSPTAPTSMHGAMHLAREIAFTAELSAPVAILRPTLLYGAADPHGGYGPNKFRRLAEAGQEIVLFGEGEERRDHVFIDDVAELVFRVLLHRSVGALNVASGEVHSFREAAEIAAGHAGRRVPIRGTQRSGPMPHNGYRPFDVTACRTAFPDFRFTALAEGMRMSRGAQVDAR